jgi:DNA-binding response OmpR family regulator
MGEGRETALVLVVDDQRDILGLIRLRLEQALELVSSLRPNIVVLDVMLPVIDGREVTRRIRADARTAGIPVLLVSASVHEHEVQEGLDAGADDYLPKPFTAQVLRDRVQVLLERSAEASQ